MKLWKIWYSEHDTNSHQTYFKGLLFSSKEKCLRKYYELVERDKWDDGFTFSDVREYQYSTKYKSVIVESQNYDDDIDISKICS